VSQSLMMPGITGFYGRTIANPPVVAKKQILSDAYLVARKTDWVVGKIHWAEIAQNFHWLRLENYENSVSVLFNAHYFICAFSNDDLTRTQEISFTDNAMLTDAFLKLTQFVPMSKVDAERAVEESDLTRLSESEIAQINYWKPKRIGDLVYNFWD
jgi:hypothetical protein